MVRLKYNSWEQLAHDMTLHHAPVKVIGNKTTINTVNISADIPTSNVGETIPYIIGRRRVSQPNVIWYGNLRALYETQTTTETREYVRSGYWDGLIYYSPEKVQETRTVTTTVPVGFLTDIAIGLCLGPDVRLRAIYSDNVQIWSGNVGPARSTFTINAPDTAFHNSEVAFHGGAFDQSVDPWLYTADHAVVALPANMVSAVDFGGLVLGPSVLGLRGFSKGPFIEGGWTVPNAFGSVTGEANYWDVYAVISPYVASTPLPGELSVPDTVAFRGNTQHVTEVTIQQDDMTPRQFRVNGYDAENNVTVYRPAISEPDRTFAFSPGLSYQIKVQPRGPSFPNDDPAYVGISYAIFRGMRTDIRLGALSFEVERFPNPLGLSANNNRRNDDINLATAFYDVITNDWGGAGVPTTDVDPAVFSAAAAVYAAENNFCSIILDRETTATDATGALQVQGYTIMYQNPSTGKLEIKPIRETALNYGNIKTFGEGNIIDVRDFNKSSWANTVEVWRGTFVDRSNNYEPTPIIVQNVANVSSTGRGKRSGGTDYPFVMNANLGLVVSSRDLAIASVPAFEFTLVTNRDGASCLPGEIIIVNVPQWNLWSVPVVVRGVRKLDRKDNSVILRVTQYVLPDRSPIFDAPGLPFDPGVGYNPVSPETATFLTVPFWLAWKAQLVDAALTTDTVFPMVLATPENDIQLSYRVWLSNFPGAGQSLMLDQSTYPTYGELDTAIDKFDGFTTGILPSVTISDVTNPVNLVETPTSQAMREGRSLVVMDNEFFVYESAALTGPRQWTLYNVRRGLIDTVAANHAQGSRVYIIDASYSQIVRNGFTVPLSFPPNWRIASATINEQGRYDAASSFNAWTPGNTSRTMRSPRPHDTKLDGVRSSTPYSVFAGHTVDVSWKTRQRPSPTLVWQTEAAEPSEELTDETFQFHRVYFRDSANTTTMLGATTNENNANNLIVTLPANAAAGNGVIYVKSVNLFGESVYHDEMPVTVFRDSRETFNYEIEA